MKPVAFRRSTLILGLALAGLFATPHQASAGSKEIAAITAKLPVGVTIGTATTAQLSQAVINAIGDGANSRLNPSTIASEALKGAGSNASNIGSVLAADILVHIGDLNGTFPKIADDLQGFVGGASASTATGTGANPTQIPAFAAVFIANVSPLSDLRDTAALNIAQRATKSTTAIGAILGGRTLNDDFDAATERIDLARKALLVSKLKKASQQIAQYVGDSVASDNEAANFALEVTKGFGTTSKDNNFKYIVQIATGTSTSNPSAAALVTDVLFDGINSNQTVLPSALSPLFSAAVKNASKLASSVGLVADAEQVEAIGVALGTRVGLTNTDPSTSKIKIVGIAQSKVSSIAKGLVLGLTKRSTLPAITSNLTQPQIDFLNLSNSRTNRLDEIGEIGAYLLASIKNLGDFQGKDIAGVALTGTKLTSAAKRAASLVTSLMKTIITSSAKVHRDVATGEVSIPAKGTIVKAPIFQATAAEDLAGSIALTIRSLQGMIDPTVYSTLITTLTADNIGTKIAGGSKTLFTIDARTNKTISQLVHDALKDVLTDPLTGMALQTSYQRYEDGTLGQTYAMGPVDDAFDNPDRGTITEPETDIRIH